jgi:hypothetical protein
VWQIPVDQVRRAGYPDGHSTLVERGSATTRRLQPGSTSKMASASRTRTCTGSGAWSTRPSKRETVLSPRGTSNVEWHHPLRAHTHLPGPLFCRLGCRDILGNDTVGHNHEPILDNGERLLISNAVRLTRWRGWARRKPDWYGPVLPRNSWSSFTSWPRCGLAERPFGRPAVRYSLCLSRGVTKRV